MMNTRRTKLSMVRDDSQSSKTSNKKCPVVLHGDHIDNAKLTEQWRNSDFAAVPRRPTAAAAGAQVRLLKKLSRTFFAKK